MPDKLFELEPLLPKLIGGPCCGEQVPKMFSEAWYWHVFDEKRNQVHVHVKRSPTDRNFYFKESRPLYTIQS